MINQKTERNGRHISKYNKIQVQCICLVVENCIIGHAQYGCYLNLVIRPE